MSERLFVHNRNLYERKMQPHEIEHAQVHTYQNAIMLPLQVNTDIVRDVSHVYRGGVCSSEFEFIAGRIRKYGGTHMGLNCDEAYTVPRENITYRDESVIFGGCLKSHFGHALVDGTARLWYLLEKESQDKKIVFLRYPYVSYAAFDALKFVELMGIDMGRVEVITEPTQFREIIIPDEAFYPMNAYRPEFICIFDQIRDNIQPKNERKLYLSRTQYAYRTSLNEEYYENFFARRGYTVIHPETLPIEEQIAYVSGADEIVSTIGSMTHLLLFAKTDVTATFLNRSGQCLSAQANVDQVRGIEPYYVDAYINPLPVPHVNGPFLFGPNRFFQAYLDERGIDYEPDELVMDKDVLCALSSTFIDEWSNLYVKSDEPHSPGTYKKKHIYYYGEDYMWQIAQLVGAEVDNPNDLLFTQTVQKKNDRIKKLKTEIQQLEKSNATLTADVKKAQAEIKYLRNSKSWKITAPLRKITTLLGDN